MRAPRPVELRMPLDGKQIQALNEALRDTRECLAGGITFAENVSSKIALARFASTSLPVVIRHDFPDPPAGVVLLSAKQVQGDGSAQSGNRIQWKDGGPGQIQVTGVDDLTAGVLYDVLLLLLEG